MSPTEVRDLQSTVPFRPFRIILSDGTTTYDIDDPLLLIVGNRTVHVGVPASPGDQFADRFVRLDLLHITQLVPLANPPRHAQGNGQTS